MNRDHLIGAWALSAYLYNSSGLKFAEDIFGGAHPAYLEEKAVLFYRSPSKAIGGLDDGNFAKLIGIALKEHGEQAARQVELGMRMAVL